MPPDCCELWVSTREVRRAGDPGWDGFIRFVGLPHLREVRSIDDWCNPFVPGTEDDSPVYSLQEAWERLESLPRPKSDREYHLLFADALGPGGPPMHPRLRLLGYDLSDDTQTSSLLNCGRWGGILEPIARRTGGNGLLGLEDARLARSLLPAAWDNDHHAFVTVWALFEVVAPEEVAVACL